MGINKIGVVGAGTMGTGIAQVAALAGLEVIVRDIEIKFVEASFKRMSASMDKAIVKGKMTEDTKAKALSRITMTTDLMDFNDVDLVIEAVLEDLELKKSVFQELNTLCKDEAVFATNTSSMSITEIAAGSGRADKFCGIHFFNPVPVMKLVEIINGINTAEETIKTAYEFVGILGKTPVNVKKDSPGFIVNRLLVPYMNEAAKILSEGVASVEDIDVAVKLGLNHPMGPFEMLDMGGLDLAVTILDYFKEEFGTEQYAPQHVLKQMIRADKKGRKTGEGFYKY